VGLWQNFVLVQILAGAGIDIEQAYRCRSCVGLVYPLEKSVHWACLVVLSEYWILLLDLAGASDLAFVSLVYRVGSWLLFGISCLAFVSVGPSG